MTSRFDSMEVESRTNAVMPISIDSMGDRYKTTNNIYTFPSPEFWTIEKNLFFLLRNSTQRNLKQKYVMRPDYLSFDEYGTVVLKEMIMTVNGIPSVEDFTTDEITIPSFQAVVTICQDKFPLDRNVSELTEVSW